MTTHSPVANIRIAESTDSANAHTLINDAVLDLDHLVIPKYANTTARDAANPTPTTGDICYVTALPGYYVYASSSWHPWQTSSSGVDATSSVKGIVQLAGDIMGSAAAPYSRARTTTVTVGPPGSHSDYICDGTADESEINSAITAVYSAGGGRVLIRAGTYQINSRVIPQNNVHIQGEGMFSTILAATSGLRAGVIDNRAESSISTPTIGVILSDFQIDGTNFATAVDHSLYYKGVNSNVWTDCKIYNLYVHHTTATGIGVDGLLRTTIDHCIVKNCGTQWTGAVLGFNGIGIAAGGQTNESFVVSNCFVESSGNNDYLLEVDDTATTGYASYMFTHNVSVNAGRAGFRNSGAPNCSFVNNTAYNSGQYDTNSSSSGIYLVNASSHNPTNNVVRGNLVVGATSRGISLQEPVTGCVVQGNTVQTAALEGILCLGSNVVIHGNQVYKNGSHGINVGPPGGGSAHTSIVITNNHVYNNAQAVNNTNGIYINGSAAGLTNVLCQGNRLYDDQGTQTQRGIRVEAAGGTPYSGIVVKDNNCDNNKSFAYSLGSTVGVMFKNNYGGVGSTKTGANPDMLQAIGNSTGSVTLDPAKGNFITITLTGNSTINFSSGVMVGDLIILIITQDATGSRTAAWGSNFKKAGGTLTISTGANAVDMIEMRWDGTNWREIARSLNTS